MEQTSVHWLGSFQKSSMSNSASSSPSRSFSHQAVGSHKTPPNLICQTGLNWILRRVLSVNRKDSESPNLTGSPLTGCEQYNALASVQVAPSNHLCTASGFNISLNQALIAGKKNEFLFQACHVHFSIFNKNSSARETKASSLNCRRTLKFLSILVMTMP